MAQIEDRPRLINLAKIIRECQLRIYAAYVHGGDSAALQAVACGSITLEGLIVAGSLKPAAIERLAETAENLGLPTRLGQQIVDVALSTGAEFYAEIDDVLVRRNAIQVAA
jgi:PP-loop superfamily ATP-utilizing enzyme